MKRLIFGDGKVSKVIRNHTDVIISKKDCNLNDKSKIKEVLRFHKPDIVINCAAKTNLEYCQENKSISFDSNVNGVLNVLEESAEIKSKFIHVSSGCLFDGNDFISDEKTNPSPSVWYTWTKKWADEIILNFGYENVLILRPRQLISKKPHPSNMITKFSSMKKIDAIEEDNSVTCIEDFSEMINHLIKIDGKGIYNCANKGTVTPYDIAMLVRKYINHDLKVSKIGYNELLENLPNKRVNTILCTKKIEKTGFVPRDASEALEWCVKNYEK